MTHYSELLIVFKECPLIEKINLSIFFFKAIARECQNSALGLINCCFFNLKTVVSLCMSPLIQGKSIPFLVCCSFQRNGHIVSIPAQVIVWTYHAYIYPTVNGMPGCSKTNSLERFVWQPFAFLANAPAR